MSNKVSIIAEAGVNHNGDIEQAKKLIDVAAEARADFVKFQSFKAEKLVSQEARKADYQSKNIDSEDDKQYNMLKALELSDEDHLTLIDYCKSKGIQFLSTAFDTDGLDYLDSLGLPLFKSPSGEITNYPYLKKLAGFGKSVVLSTGMANLGEIEAALEVLLDNGLQRSQITVLHCNTEYPTPMEDVNLRAMQTIQQAFGVAVGYSDHTLGIEVPIAAVALGASVIEKHFTLDRNLPGPDQKASLEPDELKAMVSAIRNIELAVSGHSRKEPSPSELVNRGVVRKSIHTKKSIKKDEEIKDEHLIALRPNHGISPMRWSEIVGKKASIDIEAGKIIAWNDLK